MDFKGVNLVINYDFPNSDYVYIHRIGKHHCTDCRNYHTKLSLYCI